MPHDFFSAFKLFGVIFGHFSHGLRSSFVLISFSVRKDLIISANLEEDVMQTFREIPPVFLAHFLDPMKLPQFKQIDKQD